MLRSLEHQEAKKEELLQLAFAYGYLDSGVSGVFCNLTKEDIAISICYRDGSVRTMPWSVYKEDARKLTLDLL